MVKLFVTESRLPLKELVLAQQEMLKNRRNKVY